MNTRRFLKIDEEGYLLNDGLRLLDDDFGRHILSHLKKGWSRQILSEWNDQEIIIESFDAPLVVQFAECSDEHITCQFPYGYEKEFGCDCLRLDLFDRLCGREKGIGFVFSRKAQSEFFLAATEVRDSELVFGRQTIATPDFYEPLQVAKTPRFWNERYDEKDTPWNLGVAHPAMPGLLSKLKLPKSRICVVGSGHGHDAHALAERGHIVTGIDLSPKAIQEASVAYKDVDFVQADLFERSDALRESFDVVFEHTTFCAVDPRQRASLIKTYRDFLRPSGFLFGIFFVFCGPKGPPYGSTEWEIRELLKKNFRFLHWERLRNSPERRLGYELGVIAQKK